MKIVPQAVELLRSQGTDLDVVNAARVSFHKTSDQISVKDIQLISYLARHNHWTPFGHVFLTFRIKAPIYVARQLVKHQVGLVWNEVSRRYVDDEPEYYLNRIRERAENVKQGSGGEHPDHVMIRDFIKDSMAIGHTTYLALLDRGVAPEVARMVLPLNTMTEWVWSGSLMAFSRVYKLRIDPHSQEETREIAQLIGKQIPNDLLFSWEALTQ